MSLEEFDPAFVHTKGEHSVAADALSGLLVEHRSQGAADAEEPTQ